jgi:hypothetical protein
MTSTNTNGAPRLAGPAGRSKYDQNQNRAVSAVIPGKPKFPPRLRAQVFDCTVTNIRTGQVTVITPDEQREATRRARQAQRQARVAEITGRTPSGRDRTQVTRPRQGETVRYQSPGAGQGISAATVSK